MNITSILNTRATPPLCIQTLMYTHPFVTIWRSYIGELRKMENGHGYLHNRGIRWLCFPLEQNQLNSKISSYTLRLVKAIFSPAKRSKGTLLVILHYLLKNNNGDR